MLKGNDNLDQLDALKSKHERALSELQTSYAQVMGVGVPQHSRMTAAYREAVEQRMQRGTGQSLKDSLGKISGSSQKAGMDNEDKSFWEGFRKGLGLKDDEEVGGGRPGDIGFSAMDTAEHTVYKKDYNAAGYQQRSGLHEADLGLKLAAVPAPAHVTGLDDEASQSNGEGGQFSSFVYGYSEDNPLLDDVKPLKDPDAPSGEDGTIDRDEFDNPADYWDAVEVALNEYIESDDAQGAAGFILNNEIDISEMERFLPGMAEQISGIINQEGTVVTEPGPTTEDICDQIIDIYEDNGLLDEDGVDYDALKQLYNESPEIFDRLRSLYQSLGLYNENLAFNKDKYKEINEYNPDVFKNLAVLDAAIRQIETEELLKENKDRIDWVDPSGFSTAADYYKSMITTYNELRIEDPVLADAFMENNLPEGEEITCWSEALKNEIGTAAANEFMDGLDDEVTTDFNPDHMWDPGQTNVGYGTINIDGEDYAIIPSMYGDDYEVVESISCNDFEFSGAKFAWNFNLTDGAPKWYAVLDILSQAAEASSSVQVDVVIVEQDGEQRVIIKYYDPVWTSLNLKAGETLQEINNDGAFKISLSEAHTESEYGYIFCSGGKTMLMPLIYPDDRILVNDMDLTTDMHLPAELSDELVRRIEEALASSGIYIDLP